MNMNIRLCSLIIIVLAGLLNAAVWAQSMVERFDRIDRNRDGKVTREEAASAPWFDQLLRRFDRNGNGVLERNEIAGTGLRRRTGGTGDLQMPKDPAHTKHLNIRYAEIEGVDPNLLSLDLYVPKTDSAVIKRPVLIMIHGGGWRRGDKAGPAIRGAKLRHFVGKGYVYASINYRLSPEMPHQDSIEHPIHAQDCAKAIAWIHDHIAEYGGDPGQLHLMGHSAGGHLAGIVGTNDRFLKAEGKDLSILKSNVLLDPAAIDIPRYIELTEGRKMTPLYELAFGKDEANWRDASPQHHVASGKHIPPTLIFYAGDRMNLDQLAPALAMALNKAGSPSQAVDTVSLDHGQINSHIGMIDEPMTDLIMRLHAGEDASIFPAVLPKQGEVADVENKADTAGD
jgi:acetyl esterase/lipase